jgi:hypothetical protein
MQDIDTKSLITINGGAKQVPAATLKELHEAQSFVADSEGAADKARIGKGNVVEIHQVDGDWAPFSSFE